MENVTEPQKEENNSYKPLLLLFLFCLVIGFWHWLKSLNLTWQHTPTEKDVPLEKEVLLEKKVLLEMYKVNKRTFLKWVHLFCYTDQEQFAIYCTKRKVSQSEYDYIVSCLGEPSDSMPVRSKGEIVDHTEGSYETLRSEVLDNLHEIGISKKVYDSLNVFPPLIALRIRDYYQHNAVNATVHSF